MENEEELREKGPQSRQSIPPLTNLDKAATIRFTIAPSGGGIFLSLVAALAQEVYHE